MATHIARWDLDKTYLRTDFDTLRDLVRTAFERPEQKRTNPGASTLLREMVRAGIQVHILSGSPEQMRRRLEEKLRLDGVRWDTLTLKPNLRNLLHLRFRAVRDQLGYKLPALLRARVQATETGDVVTGGRETLFGDDAEADVYVYSLYADVVAGRVQPDVLERVLERGRLYEDVVEDALSAMRALKPTDVVERILIHLEQQTPPGDFRAYGPRIVPFYNYLQAAFVLFEDGRLGAQAVLRVAVELATEHRFGGDALARSYLDLARRGHLRGESTAPLVEAFEASFAQLSLAATSELRVMVERLAWMADVARSVWRAEPQAVPDYLKLVSGHNPRTRHP